MLGTITVALVLIGLVSNVVVYFSDILLILVMAWLFAFILSPLASWIERRLPVLPRVVVVGVVYTLLFVLLSAIVVAASVAVADSFQKLIQDRRWQPDNLPTTLAPLQAQLKSLGINVDLVLAVNQAAAAAADLAGDQTGAVTNLAVASLGIIGNLLMVVFLSVFIVIDKERIIAFFNRLAPPRYADEVRAVPDQRLVDRSAASCAARRSRALVLGLVAAVSGLLLKVPFWPATAVIVALLQMIPFFGPFCPGRRRSSWRP